MAATHWTSAAASRDTAAMRSRRTTRAPWIAPVAALLLFAACAHPTLPPPPPAVTLGHQETGMASLYSHPYHGRRTASGEVYDMRQMTAAHRTLPFGTWVLIENCLNGQTVEVRITDRGPLAADRILDLSAAAARVLGAVAPGVIPVRIRVIRLPGAPESPSSKTFAVQIASFTSEYRAQVFAGEIRRTWSEVYVQPSSAGGQTIYRVRVGRYPTRSEAERRARQLAGASYDVLVVGE